MFTMMNEARQKGGIAGSSGSPRRALPGGARDYAKERGPGPARRGQKSGGSRRNLVSATRAYSNHVEQCLTPRTDAYTPRRSSRLAVGKVEVLVEVAVDLLARAAVSRAMFEGAISPRALQVPRTSSAAPLLVVRRPAPPRTTATGASASPRVLGRRGPGSSSSVTTIASSSTTTSSYGRAPRTGVPPSGAQLRLECGVGRSRKTGVAPTADRLLEGADLLSPRRRAARGIVGGRTRQHRLSCLGRLLRSLLAGPTRAPCRGLHDELFGPSPPPAFGAGILPCKSSSAASMIARTCSPAPRTPATPAEPARGAFSAPRTSSAMVLQVGVHLPPGPYPRPPKAGSSCFSMLCRSSGQRRRTSV